jgi:hypothetical protein
MLNTQVQVEGSLRVADTTEMSLCVALVVRQVALVVPFAPFRYLVLERESLRE